MGEDETQSQERENELLRTKTTAEQPEDQAEQGESRSEEEEEEEVVLMESSDAEDISSSSSSIHLDIDPQEMGDEERFIGGDYLREEESGIVIDNDVSDEDDLDIGDGSDDDSNVIAVEDVLDNPPIGMSNFGGMPSISADGYLIQEFKNRPKLRVQPCSGVRDAPSISKQSMSGLFGLSFEQPLLKVEVMTSGTLSFSMTAFYLAIFISFLYLIAFVILINTLYYEPTVLLELNAKLMPILVADLLLDIIIGTAINIITVMYVVRIIRLPVSRQTLTQRTTCALLIFLSIAMSPAIQAVSLYNTFNPEKPKSFTQNGAATAIINTTFVLGTYYYALMVLKILRTFPPKRVRKRYIIGNLVIVLLFQAAKLTTAVVANLRYTVVPFGAFVNTFILLGEGCRQWIAMPCMWGITALEVCMLAWVWYSLRKTATALANVNYCKYRYKQLFYRFFLYQIVITWCALVVYEVVLTLATPISAYILLCKITNENPEENVDMRYGSFFGFAGLFLILFAFAFQVSFVSLPATAHGILGWIVDVEKERPLQEHAYLLKEDDIVDAYKDVELDCKFLTPNFCLETAVLMLNNSKVNQREGAKREG